METRIIQPENSGPRGERPGDILPQSVSQEGAADKATECCSATGCGNSAIVSLQHKLMCLTHFQLMCYARLEELARNMDAWSRDGSAQESALSFLEECCVQATSLSQAETQFANEDRACLLTIAFWAFEIGRELQQHA